VPHYESLREVSGLAGRCGGAVSAL
jgi:hypothetical protein